MYENTAHTHTQHFVSFVVHLSVNLAGSSWTCGCSVWLLQLLLILLHACLCAVLNSNTVYRIIFLIRIQKIHSNNFRVNLAMTAFTFCVSVCICVCVCRCRDCWHWFTVATVNSKLYTETSRNKIKAEWFFIRFHHTLKSLNSRLCWTIYMNRSSTCLGWIQNALIDTICFTFFNCAGCRCRSFYNVSVWYGWPTSVQMTGLSKQDCIQGNAASFITDPHTSHARAAYIFEFIVDICLMNRTPWRAALAFRQWRGGFNAGGPHKCIGKI